MLKDYLSKLLVFAVIFWATGTAFSQSPLTVSAPAGIAGDYEAVQAAFGPWADAQSGTVMLIDDGAGATVGCDPASNVLTGMIALIDRGACGFTTKAFNAEAAGAIAVVICNNNDTEPDAVITMAGGDNCALTIPAVMISYNSCQTIKAEIVNGVTATMPANMPGAGEAVGAEIALAGAGTYTVDTITGEGSVFSDATAAKVYSIVAPSDAAMNVNACLGGADTRLAVLQGCRNGLTLVGDNDDACEMTTGSDPYASDLSVVVYAGETYLIHWDDRWDANGFDFNVSFGALPTVNITFNVDMSQTAVDPSGVKIAGSFNSWSQSDMTDNGDGTWSYTTSVTAGDELQWKYLNGTDGWENSADLGDCGVDDGFGGFNRDYVAGLDDTNLGLVCIGSCFPCPPPPCSNPNAIICDNFDTYATGSTTAANAVFWSTWSGAVGGAEDGIVSDAQAASAPNSLLVGNSGAQDVLLLLGNQTGGKYRLSWNMYIPANHVAYYNVQEDETAGVGWNLNMHFGNDTGGNTAVFGEGVVAEDGSTFTYPEDTWFEVVHMFDLDGNNLRTFVNGVMVSSMDYTGNLGAIDMFSINSDNTYYIDDVEYTAVLTQCAADAIICDGLEFYATGSNTGAQASWWSTWSGATGGAEDGIVSDDQAYEGVNSMLVGNSGAQDVLLLLGNKSAGSYRLSWQMYVPTGAHGYFNIQDEETPGVQWNMEVYLNRDASGTEPPGLGETTLATDNPFAFPQDQWFEVAMAFDLDNDQMAVFIDGTRIGMLPYPDNIGGIDFFSVDNNNTYYIDNILYTELPSCGSPDALICDNLEFYEQGSGTGDNAAWWSTWSGATNGPEDGIVSGDYAQSGTNSLLVSNTGAQDVLLLLGNQTSGSYDLSWSMYIPAGHVGYYNVQEDETPGVGWNLNMHFGNDTGGTTATFGEGVVAETGTTFTYPEDQWFDVVHTFNLDDNTMDIWVDGVQVESGAAFTGNLGSIDIFSINSDNTVYIDDVLFEALPVPTVSVTFAVDLTYYLDAGNALETVKIAGNFGTNGAALPDWSPPDAPVFTDMGDDVWSTTIEFPASSAGQELEFKFLNTADSWGDCGLQQECMGEEDANCKSPNNDNRLLVIPSEDTDLCFTWETCFGCNVVATHEFIDIPMTIAPNPFSEQTVVSFNSAILDGTVSLTNLAGQVIRVYTVNGPQLIIAKGDLAPGMYFLNVVTEDGMSAAQKLVVE